MPLVFQVGDAVVALKDPRPFTVYTADQFPPPWAISYDGTPFAQYRVQNQGDPRDIRYYTEAELFPSDPASFISAVETRSDLSPVQKAVILHRLADKNGQMIVMGHGGSVRITTLALQAKERVLGSAVGLGSGYDPPTLTVQGILQNGGLTPVDKAVLLQRLADAAMAAKNQVLTALVG